MGIREGKGYKGKGSRYKGRGWVLGERGGYKGRGNSAPRIYHEFSMRY